MLHFQAERDQVSLMESPLFGSRCALLPNVDEASACGEVGGGDTHRGNTSRDGGGGLTNQRSLEA